MTEASDKPEPAGQLGAEDLSKLAAYAGIALAPDDLAPLSQQLDRLLKELRALHPRGYDRSTPASGFRVSSDLPQ
jgi:hypothetical protein